MIQTNLNEKEKSEIENNVKDPLVQDILEEFAMLCKFPHCSAHEEDLQKYVMERLRVWGLDPIRDEEGNIICDMPASPGYEQSPITVIQGHLDMVCAVDEGSNYDPLTDGINWVIEGDVLKSDGRSSLGADCGIGNSVLLALFRDKDFIHGPIRWIFTVEEEIGLRGAKGIQKKYLEDVKYVINVDGFKEGRVIIGSAGGRRENFLKEIKTLPLIDILERLNEKLENIQAYIIKIEGFQGGHSGYDINKGRGNAIKLLALFLTKLVKRDIPFRISHLNGGEAPNSIPRDAYAYIIINKSYEEKVHKICEEFNDYLNEKFEKTDGRGRLRCEKTWVPEKVWSEEDGYNVLQFLNNLFNGVYGLLKGMKNTVDTSANIGQIDVEDNTLLVNAFIRSTDKTMKKELEENHEDAAEKSGFDLSISEYPSWKSDEHNELAQLMKQAYEEVTGNDLEIAAEHVGLEPAAFLQKNPELVMVNAGPDIINPHALTERVLIKSLKPYAKMIKRTIELAAEQGIMSAKERKKEQIESDLK